MKSVNLVGLFIIIFHLSAFSQNSAESYDELISAEKLEEDLAVLKTNLEEVHPGLYAYHSKAKIDALFTEIKEDLNAPKSAIDFYRQLLPLLPLIANNHTKIGSPKSYQTAIDHDLPRFPFRLYHKNGRSYIVEDLSDEQVIGPGQEIISINGKPIGVLLKEMANYSSPDGFNTTFTYYALGIAFSKRYAYFIGTPENFTLEYLDKNGQLQSTNITALKAPAINAKRTALTNKPSSSKIAFTMKGDVGLLSIPSFQPESGSAFKGLLKNAFQEIKDKNIAKLIIDVRGNGGGYGEAADIVLSYLINETVFTYKDEYALVDEIPYPQYYKKGRFFKHFKKQPLVKNGDTYHIRNISTQGVKPKKNGFLGHLFVLQDAASASATAAFLGQLKTTTNAIFIGEEAGGNPAEMSANDLLMMTLPHSRVRIIIPAIRSVMNINFKNTGHGVIPDYEMTPSIEDILEKRDVVLDFTLEKALNINE